MSKTIPGPRAMKNAVVRAYPEATAEDMPGERLDGEAFTYYAILTDGDGMMGRGMTPEEAWADAYARLQRGASDTAIYSEPAFLHPGDR